MVVLFGYVFGSAIQVPDGGDYREYLMPGLFAMVTFSAVLGVMTRMATDASRGVMDRFRSMPMARLAVPFGQTGADLLTGLLMLAIMVGAGLLVGWQPHLGLIPTAQAFLLMIVLRYALSWVASIVGLVVKNGRSPTRWCRWCCRSRCCPTRSSRPQACRAGCASCRLEPGERAHRRAHGSCSATRAPSGNVAWPLAHPVATVLLWSAALLAIFVPLSIRAYMRRGR